LTRCAVRVSLGSSNSPQQVDSFLKSLRSVTDELKGMSAVAI